ncbi:molybdopterin-dependent oxidoreductase [Mycolicibacterium sp. P9-22]|uniref:molybdopterin-containing oxidoreductase family protein n=1 Tax=Mycolicibacterium sp. P9-22 TaxID=2024613 RepID=UPI0011EEA865|nr:molybdopterin-dependent oxidoreductase [Mycolicibacterium sp. P9-22]KAA0109963.1 formate dehydrogenase [Mycolicibacterium sp. P9-22]
MHPTETSPVYTHCRYCLSLCGIEITLDESGERVESIRPDRSNPYSWADFCRKGLTAAEVRNHPYRLTSPMRRVGDRYEPATYAEALEDISRRLNDIIDEHGPDAVGSYSGNPLGFAFHDTIFFTGLLDAIGTHNRFWVGSVDQNAAHVVQKNMYGSDLLGLSGDVDECDYFLLLGMDPSVSKFGWIESVPNGWNRVLERRDRGATLVLVDPRRSDSAERADLHLPIVPGTDWAFLLAVVKVTLEDSLDVAPDAVAVTGMDALRGLVAEAELRDLSGRCGVHVETIEKVARDFATARTAMCITHTGVVHNEGGTVGEWLGHVLNLITNRVDMPGGKRFERGIVNLAKTFEMMAPPSEHRTRLRGLPTVAGYHALAELADEIRVPGPGQIRAMVIASGNPVVSGPDSAALDDALGQLDLLVAVDIVQRESHRHAHWLIPGTHWLERGELNPGFAGIANSPFVQMSHQALPKPDLVWEEWDFFLELALHLKRPLFGHRGVATLAKLSRLLAKRTGRPQLGLNGEWITRAMVAVGRRVRYRDIVSSPHGLQLGAKRYGDLAKALMTPDGKVQAAPMLLVTECRRLLSSKSVSSSTYPFTLINRRIRESMNSWLNDPPGVHVGDRRNYAEIDDLDADSLDLADGEVVRLVSESGAVEIPVRVTTGGRRGVVAMAHGWGSRAFDPCGDASPVHGTNRNLLVSSTSLDRLSQTPTFNSTYVRIEKLTRDEPLPPGCPTDIAR